MDFLAGRSRTAPPSSCSTPKIAALLARSSLVVLALVGFAGATAPQGTPQPSPSPEELARYVKSLDLDTLLGQVLMVGIETGDMSKANEKLRDAVRKYKVGGVFLHHANFPLGYKVTDDEMARTVASLTNSLQAAAFAAQPPEHRIPLFIGLDQEGGNRLIVSKGVTGIPNHVFLGGTRSEELARQAGFVIGSEMRYLGVNVVLAPVADVNNNSRNDVIGMRSFGANPDLVAPLSRDFAKGLQAGGVLAVAKHFPGHGTSADDPHFVLPKAAYRDKAQLRQSDLKPFLEVIAAGVDGIMTAHILVTPLDGEYPITISSKAVQGLLRNELGFHGLVFTDDLTSMMGILLDESGSQVRTRGEVARRALEVGSDVLIFGQIWLEKSSDFPARTLTLSEFDEIHKDLVEFFGSPEKRFVLEQAVERILAAKARLIPWSQFGTGDAWLAHPDWDNYRAMRQTNRGIAEKIARESSILISEHGQFVNDVKDSLLFPADRGPLSKDVILHSGDKITLVSPVFYPPDKLDAEIRRQWLARDRIETVRLVYGWRGQDALKYASTLWREPVERLAKADSFGHLVFQEDAIHRKVDEILRKSTDSRIVVFAVLLRDQIKVLEEICRELGPSSGKELVVVLFVEPYFVPSALYRQTNTTFLYTSPAPDIFLISNLLFGQWRPKDVSYLSVSIPDDIDRSKAMGAALIGPTEQRETPGDQSRRRGEGEEKKKAPPEGPKPSARRSWRSWWPAVGAAGLLAGLIALLALRAVIRRRVAGAKVKSVEAELKLPATKINNIWYRDKSTTTVIVFVHGILSDSRGCWLFVDPRNQQSPEYWPHLIAGDVRFGDVSIYLAGYYTAPDAESYKTANIANDILGALRRHEIGELPVLARRRLVFVCHSTGGNVIRYLLERYLEEFKEKEIGLVLIAAPSYGSSYADRIGLVSRFMHQRLGLQLRWGNEDLRELDSRFKQLMETHAIPGLVGIEAVENHFVFHRRWLPPLNVVVDEESAARYFGPAVTLANTDHFSAVKPDSRTHPAYQLLVDFWTQRFNEDPALAAASKTAPEESGKPPGDGIERSMP
jgi:beta-glucosidase-like glycosyl hydrolase